MLNLKGQYGYVICAEDFGDESLFVIVDPVLAPDKPIMQPCSLPRPGPFGRLFGR